MKHAITIYLHALTPLHSGTGQTAAVIDLPIAREKTTAWPVIPASGLKGALRGGRVDESANHLYGSLESAGEVLFSDLHLLFFPGRSLYGTFAYLTCPLALQRFRREARALGLPEGPPVTPPLSIEQVVLTTKSPLAVSENVYLDDLDLKRDTTQSADALAEFFAMQLFSSTEEQAVFRSRVAVIHDDLFGYLTQHACEVTARVALKADIKAVDNLWYEEAVPAEAIFHGPLGLAGRNSEVEALPSFPPLVQLGGKESVGRGVCRLIIPERVA